MALTRNQKIGIGLGIAVVVLIGLATMGFFKPKNSRKVGAASQSKPAAELDIPTSSVPASEVIPVNKQTAETTNNIAVQPKVEQVKTEAPVNNNPPPKQQQPVNDAPTPSAPTKVAKPLTSPVVEPITLSPTALKAVSKLAK